MPRRGRGAALIFAGDVAARLLGFAATVHLTRVLGPDGFGMLIVGGNLLSYALWFGDLGLQTLGAREMALAPGERRFGPGVIARGRIAQFVVVLLLAELLAWAIYGGGPLHQVVALYLLAMLPFGLQVEWLHQGRERYGVMAAGRSAAALLFALGALLLVTSEEEILLVPILFGAGAALSAILLGVMAWRRGEGEGRDKTRTAGVGEALRTARSIGIGGILAQSVQLLPPILLGWFSTTAAGNLGAAMRVVFVLLMVDRVFGALFLPTVTRLWSEDRSAGERFLERLHRLVTTFGLAVAIALTIAAPALTQLIFGDRFLDAALPLAILAWFVPLTLVNTIYSFGLIATGNERPYLRATALGGACVLLLSAVLIPMLGLMGGALSITLGEVAIVLFTWLAYRRVLATPAVLEMAAGALAAGIIVMLFLLIGAQGIVAAIAATLLFLLTAMLVRSIRRDDILWLFRT